MVFEPKVKVYIDKDFSDLVKPVLESLEKQFEFKKEAISLELQEDLKQANIYIGKVNEENQKDLAGKKVIAIFDKRCPAKFFDYFLSNEIVGVFRKENLQIEYEEKGKLENTLKKILREMQSGIHYESNKAYQTLLFKDITNWKFDVDQSQIHEIYGKKKYISVFLDPSMHKFSTTLRKIIEDFKRSYESYEFKNLRREVNDYIENLSSKKDYVERLEDKLIEISKKSQITSLPSLLLEGETGTGKSMIADIIAQKVLENHIDVMYTKFSLVNISENIVDSELFGSREGAFTDARTMLGRIVTHAFGVVFLDEIAEVPPQVQAKLLLYMDDYMVRPVGSAKNIFAPCFIIAATNKDLSQEIKEGRFREDLYHRFKYVLKIPPMKERKEDISFLINFVLLNPNINPYDSKSEKYAVQKISLGAIEKLRHYDFPGNFRELEHILKNAVNLAISDGLDIIIERHIQI